MDRVDWTGHYLLHSMILQTLSLLCVELHVCLLGQVGDVLGLHELVVEGVGQHVPSPLGEHDRHDDQDKG